jgi:hypothetical protein
MGDLCIYYMENDMNIKSLILIGLFANFLFPSVGNTAALENGLRTNGLTLNGLTLNGLTLNGLTLNGLTLNGLTLNGLTLNGLTFNGFRFNGISWNGRGFNGIGANGSSETRETPVAGTYARLAAPLDGIALNKVTVTLPPR